MNWEYIRKMAGVDDRCRQRLEEKRAFDQMSRQEKKEWCLSMKELYWKEVDKLSDDEMATFDKTLAEISDDSKDLEELILLDKAKIADFQLDAVELTDNSDFDPDEFFDLRSAILHLSGDLGTFMGIKDVREAAQKYPEREQFEEALKKIKAEMDKERSEIKEKIG